LGLLTCKNRLPYNLYCVGGDVKHCSLTQLTHSLSQVLVFGMIYRQTLPPHRHCSHLNTD